MVDYIVLGLVILVVIAIFICRIRRVRKNKGCDGNCSSCGHKH